MLMVQFSAFRGLNSDYGPPIIDPCGIVSEHKVKHYKIAYLYIYLLHKVIIFIHFITL